MVNVKLHRINVKFRFSFKLEFADVITELLFVVEYSIKFTTTLVLHLIQPFSYLQYDL
jgi:hypothetical protein